jgi:hypothetical protein
MAMVAMVNIGPRSRSKGSVMVAAPTSATPMAATKPIQGLTSAFRSRIVDVYAPSPKKAA